MYTLGRKQVKSESLQIAALHLGQMLFHFKKHTCRNFAKPVTSSLKARKTTLHPHNIAYRTEGEQKPKSCAERSYMWFVPFLFPVLSKGHLQILQLPALTLAKVPRIYLKHKSYILLWEQECYLSHDCLEDTVKVSSFLPQISRRRPTQLSRQEMCIVTICTWLKTSPVINVYSYKLPFSREIMAAPSEDFVLCKHQLLSVLKTPYIALKALLSWFQFSQLK